MPYGVKQNVAGCTGYAVVNDEGELKGCHPGKSAAMAQMRALYAATADEQKMKDKKKKIY
jgi:Na+-translocating ferredoxin:NAD+ oxidoreductase RNF subunit RnfB